MAASSSSSFKFIPFAIVALVVSVLLLAVTISNSRQGFPNIAGGIYVGKISGLGPSETTLYLERLSGTDMILFAPFLAGWTPQTVELAKASSADAFSPLELNHEGVTFTLSGKGKTGEYSGEVTTSDGKKGSWLIHSVVASTLRQSELALGQDFDLRNWLRLKSNYNQLKQEIETLNAVREQLAQKYEKLQKSISDENLLRDRSQSRREALTEEINKIAEIRKKNTKELSEIISDIGTLSRTSKRGQIVEIARRITRRENKWYTINWSSTENPENLEEQLAEQEQIDIVKLNAAAKRAEEISRMQKTLNDEISRIQWLEAEYNARLQPAVKGGADSRNEEKPAWWKQWSPFD